MISCRKMLRPFDPTPGADVCLDRICACMVLYAPFPLIWYASWLLSEKNALTFWPNPGPEGVSMDKIFATILLYASYSLIWLTTWPYSEKMNIWHFDPTQGVGSVCEDRIFAFIVLYAPFPFNLICHIATFRKKSSSSRVCMRAKYLLSCCCMRRFI